MTCQCQKVIQTVSCWIKVRNFTTMSKWQEEKERYLERTEQDRRIDYKKEISTIQDIPTWSAYAKIKKLPTSGTSLPKSDVKIDNNLNSILSEKISIFQGDITSLEIDAIVNAANKSLRGGGGVDGAIHRAAGPYLLHECVTFYGCKTGEARITGGYKLPAKYVIHTPGPQGEKQPLLQQCYRNCLKIMLEQSLRTIAFPCISTGIYGYPNEAAAHVAAYEVRKHLEQHKDAVDRVIFCIFLDQDLKIYESLLHSYFPLA